MLMLLVGFGAGVLLVFLLRTLAQYERASLARMGDAVVELEERSQALQRRIEVLEAIAVADGERQAGLNQAETLADTERAASRTRERS